MLLRVAVFLMMALGLVGFATIAWFSLQPPQAAASNDELHKEHILVASRDLRPGALLKPDDVGMQLIDQEKIPEGASPDTAVARHTIIGAMVRRPMTAGEVLLPRDILRPVERGFLAAVLGDGMRAVTVGVDAITGTAGLIWPGDHVDVLLTQTIEDATRPLGRRIAAETVLTDVRVIAIDQQLAQGATPGSTENKPAATVTLEVTTSLAERVEVATRLGRLSLVVRAASNEDAHATVGASAGTGITWASDVSPALGSATTASLPNIVHVYRGSADGQEYHF
jgi:pilus assembly protein CpaB